MTPLELFKENGINALPVDLTGLLHMLHVSTYSYTKYCRITGRCIKSLCAQFGADGFSFPVASDVVIVYNEQRSPGRIRWTLAHELAHHVLGHAMPVARSGARTLIEREADRFAKQLLAPLPVLFACNIKSASEIARVTRLSKEASGYRLQDLIGYCPQNNYDFEMIDQFAAYIERYKEISAPDMQDLIPYKYRKSDPGIATDRRFHGNSHEFGAINNYPWLQWLV